MVCALGHVDDLVGISHACDYPPAVSGKPVLVRSLVDTTLPAAQLDRAVSALLKEGKSPFAVDQASLKSLAPDLILTQSLCRVCAPGDAEAKKAAAVAPPGAKILTLAPSSLDDIFENIRLVGEAIGALEEAKKYLFDLRFRATQIQCRTFIQKKKPKVLFLEWLDPLYSAGHWVPEMVEMAGGLNDPFSAPGKESTRLDWEKAAAFNPDVIICAPCGRHLDGVLKEIHLVKDSPARARINAFAAKQVYAVDADSYFARPGPRVVDGIELLAHILHPRTIKWKGDKNAFRRLTDL